MPTDVREVIFPEQPQTSAILLLFFGHRMVLISSIADAQNKMRRGNCSIRLSWTSPCSIRAFVYFYLLLLVTPNTLIRDYESALFAFVPNTTTSPYKRFPRFAPVKTGEIRG